jgi:peptidoglycan/xylan/chitin deacetylase (PgdA/CDA1 family)
MLAQAGHDLEPHSVNHLIAPDYVHAHSIDDYLNDEVLPSIQIMVDAGYHPTTFAFPGGATTAPITDAVLQHIDRVRTTPAPCPY